MFFNNGDIYVKRISWVVALSLATSLATTGVSAEAFKAKETKIIGGIKAASGAWPFMVALLDTAKLEQIESGNAVRPNGQVVPASEASYQAQICGASLIQDKWVLTAAHCVVNENGTKIGEATIKALVGTSDLLSGGQRIDIKRIIVHPDYDNDVVDSDVALIELKTTATTPKVSVSGTDAATGSLATVIGWGALDPNQPFFPSELYQVQIPVVNSSSCHAVYDQIGYTDNMFCAGYAAGGKDSCKADSGGPLMVTQNGKSVQVGVTSWGVGCAEPGHYGVYTRLSKFDNWIEGYTKPASTSSGSGGGSIFFLLAPLFLIRLFRRSVKNVAA